jgi:hypothetical protein
MNECGRKVRIFASKTAIWSMKVMISPSVSKVNGPIFLISLPIATALVSEAAPAAQTVPAAGGFRHAAFAKGQQGYHWASAAYIQNSTRTLLIGH